VSLPLGNSRSIDNYDLTAFRFDFEIEIVFALRNRASRAGRSNEPARELSGGKTGAASR
jgi:hypothetical protein